MQETDDISLIEKINNGQSDLFSHIIDRYKNQVARTVVGMLGHTIEADDVGQEVFIRFYKSMDKFRGDSSLSTYLTRIAINLSLNALKKRKRQQVFQVFSQNGKEEGSQRTLDNLPCYDDEHQTRDTQELVQLALNNIDIKFRSVIVLRMLQGFSTKETADTLDIPLGTVLSRLTRAQEKLKIELKKLGYEE